MIYITSGSQQNQGVRGRMIDWKSVLDVFKSGNNDK